MKRGFTLLELIIVIIIIGVLATLGFSQYTRIVERGRGAEAKMILGTIRSAQAAYQLEWSAYATDINSLAVQAPGACATTHYFSYSITATAATATRCTAGGKLTGPAYTITLNYATGALSGTQGYY